MRTKMIPSRAEKQTTTPTRLVLLTLTDTLATTSRPTSQRVRLLMALAAALALPSLVRAQTDYYNTDKGRPVRIEDAYATERYAFELQFAPLRLERSRGGIYHWGLEPELAYGILPRTHLEIGFPMTYADLGGAQRRAGLTGIDVSVLHNLNAETLTLPAFGVVAEVLAPVGSLAPDKTYASAKAIATRTFGWARFHLNGEYTFGSAPAVDATTTPAPNAAELSRWLGGVAVDKTFPLKSMLVTGEVFARQPVHSDADVEWNAGAGVRYQVNPVLALDAGLGRRLTGPERSWFVTFGLARAFAIRALMPR